MAIFLDFSKQILYKFFNNLVCIIENLIFCYFLEASIAIIVRDLSASLIRRIVYLNKACITVLKF